MASQVLRLQLQERALKAEKLIEQLKPYLQRLKAAAVGQRCQTEVERLRADNEKLRREVEVMTRRLTDAERANGVAQVKTLVAPSTVVCVGSAGGGDTTPQTTCGSTNSMPEVKKDQNKPEKKTKAKKESKPAADSTQPGAVDVDVSRLLLKVGKIVDVKKHPDADSLYVETVDLAEERPRIIISGLVHHVPIEQMQDRLAVFACNLKPAKMRGILSEGMIMCASTPDRVQIVDVPQGAVPGDVIRFDKYPGEADKQLNPKKKIWEALVPDLKTDADGVATYKGCPFTIPTKGICQAPGCPNFPIK